MNRRYAIAIGVGIAAIGVGIAVSPQGIPRVQSNSPGLIYGHGKTGDPLDVVISTDGTISGTGSAGSPLSSTTIIGLLFGWFGDGSDGDCNWDGSTTVVGDAPLTATTYTTSGWRFCANATVSTGVLVDAPYPIIVKGTLNLSGTGKIHRNGPPVTANSACPAQLAAAWSTATIAGTGANITCIILPTMLGTRATTTCAAAPTIAGTGNNGNGGVTATDAGCGGSCGGTCNSGTAGGNAAGTLSTTTATLDGGFPFSAMGFAGYASFFGGTAAVTCGGGAGGGTASAAACGGSSGGHVIVLAHKIIGTGSIEAKGSNGWTYTADTHSCFGGGGGGGGGLADVVIGTGSFPTVDVSGGTGATGTSCTTGSVPPTGCIGLHGGTGGNGHAGIIYESRIGAP